MYDLSTTTSLRFIYHDLELIGRLYLIGNGAENQPKSSEDNTMILRAS